MSEVEQAACDLLRFAPEPEKLGAVSGFKLKNLSLNALKVQIFRVLHARYAPLTVSKRGSRSLEGRSRIQFISV